jgi:hypothetical protein
MLYVWSSAQIGNWLTWGQYCSDALALDVTALRTSMRRMVASTLTGEASTVMAIMRARYMISGVFEPRCSNVQWNKKRKR